MCFSNCNNVSIVEIRDHQTADCIMCFSNCNNVSIVEEIRDHVRQQTALCVSVTVIMSVL